MAPARRVGALAKAMRDTNARVRRRAARALGDFGAHALPALTVLVGGLRDPDTSVRRDSAGALGRLTVERADGDGIYDSPLATALEEAGFRPTPRGLRLRG